MTGGKATTRPSLTAASPASCSAFQVRPVAAGHANIVGRRPLVGEVILVGPGSALLVGLKLAPLGLPEAGAITPLRFGAYNLLSSP